jgi:hypothetical protein
VPQLSKTTFLAFGDSLTEGKDDFDLPRRHRHTASGTAGFQFVGELC